MERIEIRTIVDIQKALSEPLRIKILRLLLERELCVSEIVQLLEEPQYKVSKHISVLKAACLVRDWHEGNRVHYEISPDLDPEWKEAFKALSKVWDKSRDVQASLWRLQEKVPREPGAIKR